MRISIWINSRPLTDWEVRLKEAFLRGDSAIIGYTKKRKSLLDLISFLITWRGQERLIYSSTPF